MKYLHTLDLLPAEALVAAADEETEEENETILTFDYLIDSLFAKNFLQKTV